MNLIWKLFGRRPEWAFNKQTRLIPRLEEFLKTQDRAALAAQIQAFEESQAWQGICAFIEEERLNHEYLMEQAVVHDQAKAAYECACKKSFAYVQNFLLPAFRDYVLGKQPGLVEEPMPDDDAVNE